jgi:hypothetical protein
MLHSHFALLWQHCHAILARDPNCLFMAGLVADQFSLPTRRQAATTTKESTQ